MVERGREKERRRGGGGGQKVLTGNPQTISAFLRACVRKIVRAVALFAP